MNKKISELTPPCYLPVKGLQQCSAALETGGIYLLLFMQESWTELLLSSMSTQENCLLVVEQAEKYLAPQAPSLNNVFSFHAPTHQDLPKLLNEINYYRRRFNKVIVLQLNALHWISTETLLNVKWCRRLRIWAEQHQLAIVLVMVAATKLTATESALRQIQTQLSGIVSILGHTEPGRWSIWHWFSRHQTVANQAYYLFKQDRQLKVKLIEQKNTHDEALIMDIDRVIILSEALQDEEQALQQWEQVKDLQAIENNQDFISAAYIILPFTEKSSSMELTKKIFYLRRKLGALVKIVVREIAVRMRHADESILLHFGASIVIPADINFSRFIGILKSIRELKFIRHLDEHLYHDLQQMMQNNCCGFLSGDDFCVAVNDINELSYRFGVSISLLELTPVAGLNIKETMSIAQFRRPGDIYTVAKNRLYLCLFGCRENDINRALKFIFGVEPKHFFKKQARDLKLDFLIHLVQQFNATNKAEPGRKDSAINSIKMHLNQLTETTEISWPIAKPALAIGKQLETGRLNKVT